MQKTTDSRRAQATLLATGLVLAGTGATAGALPATAPEAYAAPTPAQPASSADAEQAAASPVASVIRANAQGAFSFTQDRVTPANDIATTFSKAASVLCAALPDYTLQTASTATIQLNSPAGTMAATVQDAAEDGDAPTVRMGCACSSNVAGGGAIMNADVTGVPLAFLAQFAQAV